MAYILLIYNAFSKRFKVSPVVQPDSYHTHCESGNKIKKGVCLIDKLQRCVERKRANNSQSREVIYKILCESNECLSIEEILALAANEYPKKISLNTAYRNLRFLVECELVFMLQDDLKKAYYCLCRDEVDIFEICPKCNIIKRVEIDVCDAMKSSEFITIHKKCKKCL